MLVISKGLSLFDVETMNVLKLLAIMRDVCLHGSKATRRQGRTRSEACHVGFFRNLFHIPTFDASSPLLSNITSSQRLHLGLNLGGTYALGYTFEPH